MVVEAMLLSEVLDELINHPVSPFLTDQGSSHPGSHAVVGKPLNKTSCQMNLGRRGRQGQLDRFHLPGNAMPSLMSGILSWSISSVEYSTATFCDLWV